MKKWLHLLSGMIFMLLSITNVYSREDYECPLPTTGTATLSKSTACERELFQLSYSVPLPSFVTISSPSSIAGSYSMVPAAFGPQLLAPLTGNLVLADPSIACGPLSNAAEINGNIAVIDRGTCTFVTKVMEAQNAGAIAVIVVNNVPGNFSMGGFDPNITIPAVGISQADGSIIKDALSGGPVNVTLNALITQIWQEWVDAASNWNDLQFGTAAIITIRAGNPRTTVNGQPGRRFRVKVSNPCGDSYSNEVEIIFLMPGVASSSSPTVCVGGEYSISYSVPNLNADYAVAVNSPSSIAGSYPSAPALFGPVLLAPLSGNLVLADPSLACVVLLNAAAINGNIAVVDRGACTFYTKVLNAQDAGAIAVIVVNNQPGLVNMAGLDEAVAIPVIMISQADGILIKDAMNNGSVNMTINPFTRQIWQNWDDLSSSWINRVLADGEITATTTNPLTTVNGLPGDRFRVKVINACGESYSNEIEISYLNEGPIAGIASISVSTACEGEEFTLTYSDPDPNVTQVWQTWDDAASDWIDFADASVPQTAVATNPATTINGKPGDRLRVKVTNACGESFSNEVEIIYLIAAKASITYANSFNSPTSANVCEGSNFWLRYDAEPINALSNKVTVNSPGSVAGSYTMIPAAFGPRLTTSITGNLVLADPTNACGTLANAAEINGHIAVVDRGACTFVSKVIEAQNAGAIAVIVVNNAPGNLSMGGVDPGITIPAVAISQADGALIKATLNDGPVNVTLNALITQIWQAWDDASSTWINFANAGGDLLLIAENPLTMVNGFPGDRVRVALTNACGTSYSNELEIAYVPYPVVSITAVPTSNIYTGGDPNTIYLGYGPQSVTLQSSVDMDVSYQWYGPDLSCTDCANPVFTPTAPGEYTFYLYARSEFGCGTNASITIHVKDVRVPGKNDKVYICHQNKVGRKTLEIYTNDIQDHLKHGDVLGICDEEADTAPAIITMSSKAVEDVSGVAKGILIYPNPASSQVMVTFETSQAEPYTLRMTDILGRTVTSVSGKSNAGKNQVSVNVSSWVAGTYLVILQNGSSIKTGKVMKQ